MADRITINVDASVRAALNGILQHKVGCPSMSLIIREAILFYANNIDTSIQMPIASPAPSPGPAVGSVVHGRVWTDREARALEEMRRNPEAFPPPKHPYVENPYK